jgi:hypothetical protein
MKTDHQSMLELQALALELDTLDPLLVNPLPLVPQRLYASPSIRSVRPPRLWSTSPSAALNVGRDPLAELLAVADELKTMKNLDSDDILYMTDAPPPSPLPPTLHAFFDAPGTSLRVLEMDVHREDETFLGVPIPCIVVTSEGDSMPKDELEIHDSPPPASEDRLAPPLTTYRGRMETDQPPINLDGDSERSPSPPLSPCEDTTDEEKMGTSPPCYFPEYPWASGNVPWEVVNMAHAPSIHCTKPDRPTVPKPTPLLRRRERSLLRRMLRVDNECKIPPVEDKSQCILSKRKRKRISKDAIGSPRPLSSVAPVALLSPCTTGLL